MNGDGGGGGGGDEAGQEVRDMVAMEQELAEGGEGLGSLGGREDEAGA
ncbi:MAG: hypothetical protein NTU53_03160 [Planctomycetota bacterium]|nr:hypothetical protein [Planctomycetota bacterium]